MPTSAVVVAAGRGSRFGDALNKVRLPLDGRPLLEHSVDALAEVGDVAEIVLVLGADDLAALQANPPRPTPAKPLRLVAGGARRIDSVLAGVRASSTASDLVAIHDAARPLVRPATVAAAIDAARREGGAVVALPAIDTVKRSRDGAHVSETIPRAEIHLAQTPQVFRRVPFLRALEEAAASGAEITDDSAVAERAGIAVALVAGDPDNFKVTFPEDLARAEETLARRRGDSRLRIGTGFDLHRMVDGRRCLLGGVEIPSERGPLGHSDGDALLHAIADAILGAAGLDDLGTLFPDTDPRWRGADSRRLLTECVARARAAGFRVVNADAVVIAEKPKIAPHRAAIRASVAALLDIPVDRVNVKGKTAEGLGPIGSAEAIAVQATVLLCAAS